jgi:hypothetical protein
MCPGEGELKSLFAHFPRNEWGNLGLRICDLESRIEHGEQVRPVELSALFFETIKNEWCVNG